MKHLKLLFPLLLLILFMLSSCGDDSVTDTKDYDEGMQITAKVQRTDRNISGYSPERFIYKVKDRSGQSHRPGTFELRSSNNFKVGDYLVFATSGQLAELDSLRQRSKQLKTITSMLEDAVTAIDSLELTLTSRDSTITSIKEALVGAQTTLDSTSKLLGEAKAENADKILLEQKLKETATSLERANSEVELMSTFQSSIKELIRKN